MARSNSFNKRNIEKKKEQKRKEKLLRKEERKASGTSSFEEMIAYVDENGVLHDTPPDTEQREEVPLESIAIATPKKEELPDEPHHGTVVYLHPTRGYGFIRDDAKDETLFFHEDNAPTGIAKGWRVTFRPERGEKGMTAADIMPETPDKPEKIKETTE